MRFGETRGAKAKEERKVKEPRATNLWKWIQEVGRGERTRGREKDMITDGGKEEIGEMVVMERGVTGMGNPGGGGTIEKEWVAWKIPTMVKKNCMVDGVLKIGMKIKRQLTVAG